MAFSKFFFLRGCSFLSIFFFAALFYLQAYFQYAPPMDLNKQEMDSVSLPNLKKDKCTTKNEVCLYNHICYGIESKQWESWKEVQSKQPLLNNMGLDNRQEVAEEEDRHQYSQCNERFKPIQSKDNEAIREDKIDTANVLYIQGATYYVCCWVDHFGHILMNMVLPSFNALAKIGLEAFFKDISFLAPGVYSNAIEILLTQYLSSF